jgi:sigma-E factor negative regulatory protein RseA
MPAHPPPPSPNPASPDIGRPATPAGDDDPDRRQWLSALADGQAEALAPGCRAWAEGGAARATWHAYHVIGDVMRSDELARDAAGDAAFLDRLRGRLAQEPVPLAPMAATAAPAPAPAAARDPAPAAARAAAPAAARARWLTPAAMAAGFVAVAGVLVVARTGGPVPEGGAVQAQAQPGVIAVRGAGAPVPRPLDAGVIRDARLDQYLQAHHGALGGSTALPGAAKRNVELTVPAPAPGAPR